MYRQLICALSVPLPQVGQMDYLAAGAGFSDRSYLTGSMRHALGRMRR